MSTRIAQGEVRGAAPAQEPQPGAQLFQMLTGKWVSQALYAAATLGIADLVVEGARTAEQLAEATGSHPRSLQRLLRSLASVGVFHETGDGRFEQSPISELLRTDVPGSLRANAMFFGVRSTWRPWGEILHSVRTGKPAFDHVYGMPIFDYYQQDLEEAAIFNQAMTGLSKMVASAVLEAYDFSGIRKMVDVAGGHGMLLKSILGRYPDMQGVLFDLPKVIEGARAAAGDNGVAGRLEFVAGSFFESVPTGADAYIMKHIIHDWDDERAVAILSTCRRAIPSDGRVLLVETVVPGPNEPSLAKLLDLEMLVLPGGIERTEPEYAELFRQAGFRLSRVLRTESFMNVIEARPV